MRINFIVLSIIFFKSLASQCVNFGFTAEAPFNDAVVVKFNSKNDHISLHYDMSYDPDDYLSAVADRAVLQILYPEIIYNQTSRVIGTCGGSCSGYNTPANEVMKAIYGDVGGYKLTIGASKYLRNDAVKYELDFFKNTINRGGKVFVKEGGESDFTMKVVQELEKWKIGSGKSVYIVQHSSTNEKNAGKGVLSYVKSTCNYIKIPDGNPPYRRKNYKYNGSLSGETKSFDFYALQSSLKDAWKISFDEFRKKKSYCSGKAEPVSKCVDFSDTTELLYIVGSSVKNMDDFIKYFIK